MIKKIEGGVTTPKGYKAAGLRAGIKAGKTNKDMAMIVSEVPAVFGGTFTKNVVKAAPVLWGKKRVEQQETVRAIVVNSGIANACTGDEGMKNVEMTAKAAADGLGCQKEEVLVSSTGVIGAQLPMDTIKNGVKLLCDCVKEDRQSGIDAAQAILTTDTHKKEAAVEVTFSDGTKAVIAGMCKGSGMIHPNMGTMLGFIVSDVAITKELLQKALKADVEDTYNMVSVDGDTSTNDTVFVLANGLAGNPLIAEENDDYAVFCKALHEVNEELAKNIAGDGEGCTKLFEAQAHGLKTKEEAKIMSKSIITSSLTKAAVYGKDANWGRILCAMGYSGVDFDPQKVDIILESEYGVLQIVKDGIATDYSEEEATKILSCNPVICKVNVHEGDQMATAWGCDLTYDYVKINADYRS
ncbi:MAG: bifunctional ornithine acetyltransferase/N-acetylglutamate synthase [Lachnospiraceae bacterium]